MKNFFLIPLFIGLISCSPAFAQEKKDADEIKAPRMTDLTSMRKKNGADALAGRAKTANSVAELKQIVLELIEISTGGK